MKLALPCTLEDTTASSSNWKWNRMYMGTSVIFVSTYTCSSRTFWSALKDEAFISGNNFTEKYWTQQLRIHKQLHIAHDSAEVVTGKSWLPRVHNVTNFWACTGQHESSLQLTVLSNYMYELNTRHFDKLTATKEVWGKMGVYCPVPRLIFSCAYSRKRNAPARYVSGSSRARVYAGACCHPVCVYSKHYKGVYHGISTTLLFIGTYSSTIQVAIEDT